MRFRTCGAAPLIALALAAAPVSVAAPVAPTPAGKSPQELFPWAVFDPSIPTQENVVGFRHGARPLRHADMQRYLEALDAASPRARLIEYARSHEGRALWYLAVGDPAIVGDLDRFREEHARRMDPRGRPASGDASSVASARAVAWMAYSIHGDELSGSDAAAALAYWLVAGDDPRAARVRESVLVLIDPMENPDGRDRYLAQTAAFAHAAANPDQEDLSHTGTWPWGRGNHYLFDLNRDWFSMVHPESGRSTVIAGWNVQIVVDAHEMEDDSSFLFTPPRHPYNPLLPESHREWWARFAAGQARVLDARGYPYFTGEWNEEFFPGYGSSWAAYHGALGMLYEMSGTAGSVVRKREGSVRTYPEAVEHQLLSSVSNLETLAENRAAFLRDYLAERREWVAQAGEKVGAWVLPRGKHPERTDALVRLLRAQGIEVRRAAGSALRAGELRDAYSGSAARAADLGGDVWIVRLDHPAGRLARVLLDPHVPMEAGFLREQREYLERGRGSRLYEVTAWSMILNYGIEAYWTSGLPDAGDPAASADDPPGRLEAVDGAVAWAIDGTSDRSVPALCDLLQRGLTIKVADRPFTVDGKSFERGSLVLPVEGNPADLAEQLHEVATRWGVEARGLATGLAESGPDLGGSHFRPLVAPRVGVWTGYPVSATSYGALWHLFDHGMALRFSGLDLARFRQVDLRRFNVLLFLPVSGGPETYRALLGDSGVEGLRAWIEAGGTAIGIGNGAEFLADRNMSLTTTRLRRQALEEYPPVVLGPDAATVQRAGPLRAVGIGPENGAEPSEKDTPKGKPGASAERSPYDTAPILGPGAAPFAEGVDLGTPAELAPVDLAEWLQPYLPPGKLKPEPAQLTRADGRLRRFAPRGAFLRLELDHDVWLTWGMPAEIPVLVRTSSALVAEPPVEVAARFADLERLHLGGLLWPEAAGRIARTAYATREAKGSGQVILFIDEPEFRGWTLATRRMLQNAILHGPGLGTSYAAPW